jgi:ribonuclease D
VPHGAGPPTQPDGWQQLLAEQRARLAAATSPPPGVADLSALRAWRDEAARLARIEPQALISDSVLEAIAARRPSSLDELAAVPGMGPLLVARVGDGLLAALAAAGEREDTVPGSP